MTTASTPHMGMNRTGVQLSPHRDDMLTLLDAPVPDAGDGSLAQVRAEAIAEAEPIGTVSVPATLRGLYEAGKQMLSGHRAHALLDKLAERLAFERGGTRLYDALLAKAEHFADELPGETLAQLRQFRAEEAEHAQWVHEAIVAIGGDPTSVTPAANLVGVETFGLMQAITDPRTTLAQCLHAMLVAELADEAAWLLLVETVQQMGDGETARKFLTALEQERVHRATIARLHDTLCRKALGLGDL